jgi:hypothetical protein
MKEQAFSLKGSFLPAPDISGKAISFTAVRNNASLV